MIDVVAELRRDNKNARDIDLKICGDAIRTYVEAAENVERNGAICTPATPVILLMGGDFLTVL